jgi:hypothetical protein
MIRGDERPRHYFAVSLAEQWCGEFTAAEATPSSVQP